MLLLPNGLKYVYLVFQLGCKFSEEINKGRSVNFFDKSSGTSDRTELAISRFSGEIYTLIPTRGTHASPAKRVPQESRSSLVINTSIQNQFLERASHIPGQLKTTWIFPTTDFSKPLCWMLHLSLRLHLGMSLKQPPLHWDVKSKPYSLNILAESLSPLVSEISKTTLRFSDSLEELTGSTYSCTHSYDLLWWKRIKQNQQREKAHEAKSGGNQLPWVQASMSPLQ